MGLSISLIWGIMHLTYRPESDSRSVASPDSCEAGAPAKEIGITHAMIEVGCRELAHYCFERSNDEEVVAAIFTAMFRLSDRF
jgi:hypothetical protein